jgi:hypothetical protein
VRVCWDLDNTLVDSGTLLRAGKLLQDAIVEAQPLRNMLEFYAAMRTSLPDAEHFILSARRSAMRADTLAWLERNGVAARADAICFVPRAEAKIAVWRQLARDARLVIVDDLSYRHESERPLVHQELVQEARRFGCIYVGLEQIAQIGADPASISETAAWVARSLEQTSRSPAPLGATEG